MKNASEYLNWTIKHDIIVDQHDRQLYLNSTGKPVICGTNQNCEPMRQATGFYRLAKETATEIHISTEGLEIPDTECVQLQLCTSRGVHIFFEDGREIKVVNIRNSSNVRVYRKKNLRKLFNEPIEKPKDMKAWRGLNPKEQNNVVSVGLIGLGVIVVFIAILFIAGQ